MSDGSFTLEVKKKILSRSGSRCDWCGLRADIGQFHHRKPRRAGGTSDYRLGLPSNGLILHPKCHDYVESRRAWAMELGLLLRNHATPSDSPVRTGWGGWVLLDDDGGYTPISEVPEPPAEPLQQPDG